MTRGRQASSVAPVELTYQDLEKGVYLGKSIEEAFGYEGLGILTVSGVPGLEEKRTRLLQLARRFALLPEEVKARYQHPASSFNFGWSHGKENLQGRPDTAKGSFYANPLVDCPVDDPKLIEKYPAFASPNIWPTKDLPEFEPAFKELGQLIVEVGKLVARQCDKYINSRCTSYSGRLERIISNSLVCKARLLHYFPLQESEGARNDEQDVSTWCGWHLDHGSLTGLTSPLYLDSQGEEVTPGSDWDCGLYIYSRAGELVKASIPPGSLAFQIGETAQVHSGGLLQATPHAVKGSCVPGVSRETFAVFMEPQWDEPMDFPSGRTAVDAQTVLAAACLPSGVPSLGSRWRPGQTFSEFTEKTIQAYY